MKSLTKDQRRKTSGARHLHEQSPLKVNHKTMEKTKSHITQLFKNFARVRQKQLRESAAADHRPVEESLNLLLSLYPQASDASPIRRALLDPYFPLGMLERTLFANVVGMRFFINKLRSDLAPALTAGLRNWAKAFLRIRLDIETHYDPETVTCIPLDGIPHPLPISQWCTLCGVCCQIGGVPPIPPPGVRYPDHWSTYLAGGAVENQQLCPFLFQYFGEPIYFCAIHTIKPVSCQDFGEEDCRRRLAEPNLHA